jgi:hypothetical protein
MRAPALRVVSLGTFCLLFLSLSPSAFAQTVSVTSATPNNGPQSTLNLNVVIAGKGFAKGASAVFYLTLESGAFGSWVTRPQSEFVRV